MWSSIRAIKQVSANMRNRNWVAGWQPSGAVLLRVLEGIAVRMGVVEVPGDSTARMRVWVMDTGLSSLGHQVFEDERPHVRLNVASFTNFDYMVFFIFLHHFLAISARDQISKDRKKGMVVWVFLLFCCGFFVFFFVCGFLLLFVCLFFIFYQESITKESLGEKTHVRERSWF